MTPEELQKSEQLLRARIESLKNDATLCSQELNIAGRRIKTAPFPILMYTFATVDYFSSLWAGWNDKKNHPAGDNRGQTDRISDFMEKYLHYDPKSIKIAIIIFRHKLMHTAEPRILAASNLNKKYYWESDLAHSTEHMLLRLATPDPNDPGFDHYSIRISIPKMIDDIENGVFGPNGYFADLTANSDSSQDKFQTCVSEYANYKIET